jgi:alkylation response protein AidB-like acyl-CoA dehydrogenase
MVGHLSAALDRADVDAALEAAAAKVFASRAGLARADEMVQVAGGRGYVKPYPYERMLRDARINRIFEGRERRAARLRGAQRRPGPAERLKEIGAALRQPIANFNAVAGYATDRVRTALRAPVDGVDVQLHRRLLAHKRFLEKHTAELKGAAQAAIVTHRGKLVERQFVIERLANMAIELYARAATLARTQRLLEERGEGACAHELALCDLFCVESGRRFRDQRELLAGRAEEVDEVRRAVAARVRAAAGYDVDDAVLDPRPAGDAAAPAPAPAPAPDTSGAPAGAVGRN